MPLDPSDPTAAEIRLRLERTGESISQCVDHYWPGAADEARQRYFRRVQKIYQRLRASKGSPPPPPPPPRGGHGARPPPTAPAPPEPTEIHAATSLSRIPFLERKLSQALTLVDAVVESGQLRLWSQFDARSSALFAELEAARERERKVVKLDRTPAAISAELAKRAKAIALRAEIHRRNAERAAKKEEEP